MTGQDQSQEKSLAGWQKHRFMLMIGSTIGIALFLVGVALALYASSGAAQLDLSRPGYMSVRNQATRTDQVESFPSTGPIDKKALDQFRVQYDKQADKAASVDSFGGDAMSDQILSLDASGSETE